MDIIRIYKSKGGNIKSARHILYNHNIKKGIGKVYTCLAGMKGIKKYSYSMEKSRKCWRKENIKCTLCILWDVFLLRFSWK